jgi:hypothetical protein
MRSRSRATPPPPLHRIRSPAELLDAIPYLLGFHPQDSVVLVGLRHEQLLVTARLDRSEVELAGAMADVAASMVDGGATSLVAVVYGDSESDGDTEFVGDAMDRLADRLTDEVEFAGGCLIDVLLVRGDRWWSLTCDSEQCCPRAGRLLEPASPFAARATVEGLVALPDRAAVEATLEPLPERERRRLAGPIAEQERAAVRGIVRGEGDKRTRSVKRALFAAARRSEQVPPPELSAEEVARFGVALGETAVRDSVWLAIDDGRLDGRPLWRELARRLPDPYATPPLFLFGWASWRAGSGTLAGMAVERALRADPDYTAAVLLEAALASRVSPHTVPRLRRSA